MNWKKKSQIILYIVIPLATELLLISPGSDLISNNEALTDLDEFFETIARSIRESLYSWK